LQDRLGVKRPRLSQICNHLQRAGLLEVRQEGRSRKFSLTNDARAQLIAWGMLEVSQ
jgi:Mn-dependent DtxR family transcriptional regulator